MKLLLWAQEKLKERVDFPQITNFETCELEEPENPKNNNSSANPGSSISYL